MRRLLIHFNNVQPFSAIRLNNLSVLLQKGKNCYIQGEIRFNNLAAGVITGDVRYLCQKEMHAIFLDFTLYLKT